MHVGVCPARMSMLHKCNNHRGQRRTLDSPKLKLQTV